jgi:hypothetical protein
MGSFMDKLTNHKSTYAKDNYDGKPHAEQYIQHALGCPTKMEQGHINPTVAAPETSP